MNDQSPIDVSTLPSSEELVKAYIELRNQKEAHAFLFEKGGPTDSDMEAVQYLRQLAGGFDKEDERDGFDPEILMYVADRLEYLLTPQKTYTDSMTAIEGAMHMRLTAAKQKSAGTEYGTAFFKDTLSVKVTDKPLFHKWVRETQAWEFLTAHVVKEEVEKHLDRKGEDGKPMNIAPPGVETEWITRVQFRKA